MSFFSEVWDLPARAPPEVSTRGFLQAIIAACSGPVGLKPIVSSRDVASVVVMSNAFSKVFLLLNGTIYEITRSSHLPPFAMFVVAGNTISTVLV